MSRDERRQREQQQLRERILDAARDLFAESGYEAVTMRKIAEKIDYSPTTIYLHFEDKAALLRELCSADFLSLAQCFRAIATQAEPLSRIRAIGRAFLDFGLKRPNHYRLLFMNPSPPVPAEARRIERGSLEEDAWAMLVAAVSEAQSTGVIRTQLGSPSVIAQQFFAGVHGVLALHLARRDDPWIDWMPVNEAGERMIESLIRGFTLEGKPAATRRKKS